MKTDNIKIKDLFSTIEKLYPEITFSYRSQIVSDDFFIKISHNTTYTIEKILNIALEKHSLDYRHIDGNIIIFKKSTSKKEIVEEPPQIKIKEQKVVVYDTVKVMQYETISKILVDTVKEVSIDTVLYVDTLKVYDTVLVKYLLKPSYSLNFIVGSFTNKKDFYYSSPDVTFDIKMTKSFQFGIGATYEQNNWILYLGGLYSFTEYNIKTKLQYSIENNNITVDKILPRTIYYSDTVSSYYTYSNNDTTWHYIISENSRETYDTTYINNPIIISKDTVFEQNNKINLLSIPIMGYRNFIINRNFDMTFGVGFILNFWLNSNWIVYDEKTFEKSTQKTSLLSLALASDLGAIYKINHKIHCFTNASFVYLPQKTIPLQDYVDINTIFGVYFGIKYYLNR